MNTMNDAKHMIGIEATIQTRLRPQRVRVRSDMTPMTGSRNTSRNRTAPKMMPVTIQPNPISTA